MDEICMLPVGSSPACRFTQEALAKRGISFTDRPGPEVTHLLLDVPSFLPDGSLRGGGEPERLAEMQGITVIGGNLNHPALAGFRKLDLLREEAYLGENAAITAQCALSLAAPLLDLAYRDCRVLIFGWGRIGKCLSRMLCSLGADVTVAARSPKDIGILNALGIRGIGLAQTAEILPETDLMFNTVPIPLPDVTNAPCVKVDLASQPGLVGDDIVYARGLPGKMAPESAGRLRARVILKLLKEERP